MERAGVITFLGNPLTLVGQTPKVGDKAPDFSVLDNGLAPVTLATYAGQPLIIATVPSLDTDVCSIETKRFNDEAAHLGGVKLLVVSADLPFAQKRWVKEYDAQRIITLSDHRDLSLAQAYGVLVKELRLLTRAVFVLDKNHVLRHVQIVAEITHEPDYAAALGAAKDLK